LVKEGAHGRTPDFGARTVAGAAVFTAFVFAATFSFTAATSTGGYFDIGEVMVYITALVMGPYVGAFAGGVGSMLSDALLAPQFAPGTLVIKGAEGFIVGYLGRRGFGAAEQMYDSVKVLLAAAVGAAVAVIGIVCFPDVSLSLGELPYTPVASTPDFVLSAWLWIAAGAVAFAATYALSGKLGGQFTWIALSIFLGGGEMVLGYFLYETQVLGLGLVAPTAEIPVNLLQAAVGLILAPYVAVRVRSAFSRRMPQSRGALTS